jgi:hypothetical protein
MKDPNPLAPLERIIAVIGGLMIFFLLAVVPASLLGSGSVFGFGYPIVCVEAPYGAVATDRAHGDGVTGAHIQNLPSGVHANPSGFNLCASDPSTGQRVLATLMDLPGFLFLLGFIVIAWRLTRRVRRRGPFMPDVARALARLGVFLFVGEFVVALSQGLATQRLASTMLSEHSNYIGGYFHLSGAVIIASFGLQAMGRVMAMTVPMREEIDATV